MYIHMAEEEGFDKGLIIVETLAVTVNNQQGALSPNSLT